MVVVVAVVAKARVIRLLSMSASRERKTLKH